MNQLGLLKSDKKAYHNKNMIKAFLSLSVFFLSGVFLFNFTGCDSNAGIKDDPGEEYTITYMMDEGEINDERNPSTYNTGKTLVLYDAYKEGMDFVGWAIADKDLNPIIYPVNEIKKGSLRANVIAIPIFEPKKVLRYYLYFESNVPPEEWVTVINHNTLYYVPSEGPVILEPAFRKGWTFDGWYTDPELKNKIEVVDGITSEIKLYAKWKEGDTAEYPITYDLGGGVNSEANPVTYHFNEGKIILEDPVRKGYTFGGWYTENQYWYNSNRVSEIDTADPFVSPDLKLYARWAPGYTVTYILNGGVNDPKNLSMYSDISVDQELKPASREGYVFCGWYRDAELKYEVTDFYGKKENLILYARWEEYFPVTYELNGGTNSKGAIETYCPGVNNELPVPTKEGYNFGSWYLDSDFTKSVPRNLRNDRYTENPVAGPVTLYARWTPERYNITYEYNGGSLPLYGFLYGMYLTGETVPYFSSLEKNGYLFDGWWKEPDFKTRVTEIPSGTMGDITLYAKWLDSSSNYSITYFLNNGTNNPANPNIYANGEEVILEEPTKEDSIFLGWYNRATNEKITKIEKGTTGNISVEARWVSRCTITYELNGGENSPLNPDSFMPTVDSYTFADPLPREGYTFEGWYQYYMKKTSTDDLGQNSATLTAKWKVNEYKIKYIAVKAATKDTLDVYDYLNKNPLKYTVEDHIVLEDFDVPSTIMFYKDVVFEGWFADKEFTLPITEISAGSTGDITIYAKLRPKGWYSIKYILDGGANSTLNISMYSEVDADAGKTLELDKPYKKGYRFEGWYSDPEFTTQITEIGFSERKNWTVHAKWEEIIYHITYTENFDFGTDFSKYGPSTYTITTPTFAFPYYESTKPAYPGYRFIGWYTDPEYDGLLQKIPQGSTGDIEVYALWEKDTIVYTITYEDDSIIFADNPILSSNNPREIHYTDADVVLEPPANSIEGFEFVCWVDKSTGKAVSVLSKVRQNMVLVSKWASKTYDITFILNDGYEYAQPVKKSYKYGGTITLDTPSHIKPNHYKFGGWYYDPEFKEVFNYNSHQLGITLYAKWIPVTYNVEYDYRDFIDRIAERNKVERETYECDKDVQLMVPDRLGYNFEGWYIKENETERRFVDTIPAESIYEDLYLYAKWSVRTYTVEYELNGGTNSELNPESYLYQGEAKEILTLYEPVKEGYFFAGWYTDENYTTRHDYIKHYRDEKFYAKWSEEYVFHDTVTLLPSESYGLYVYDYVYFGDYPQTIKPADVTINVNETMTMGEFTYYKGSDKCWYAASQSKYGAEQNVYFSNGDSIIRGKTYYFRVEPIKWRRMTDYNRLYYYTRYVAEYFAENILFMDDYDIYTKDHEIEDPYISGQTKTVHPGECYRYTSLGDRLNGESEYKDKGFKQTAFTSAGQKKLYDVPQNGYYYDTYTKKRSGDLVFLYSSKYTPNTSVSYSVKSLTDFGKTTYKYGAVSSTPRYILSDRWIIPSKGVSYQNPPTKGDYGIAPGVCIGFKDRIDRW